MKAALKRRPVVQEIPRPLEVTEGDGKRWTCVLSSSSKFRCDGGGHAHFRAWHCPGLSESYASARYTYRYATVCTVLLRAAKAIAWDVAMSLTSAWYPAHPRQALLSRADKIRATGSCGCESDEDTRQDHGQGGGVQIRERFSD